MTTAEQSSLLRDLENHRFPRTVPIKQRAQRQSVVQLDTGLGQRAERLARQTRAGIYFRELDRHPINRRGS